MPDDRRIIERDASDVNGRTRSRDAAPFRARVVVALLAVACSVGCSNEGKAKDEYDAAMALVRDGELAQAVRRFDALIDRWPETDAARRARQQVQTYRGLARAETMFPVRETRDTMILTARALQGERDARGRWPDSLERLVPARLDALPVDAWGNRLIYRARPRNRGYVLASLGSDRREGGDGDARDLFIVDGRETARPPEGFAP